MSYIVRVQLVNEDTETMFSDFEDPYLGETDKLGDIYRGAMEEFGRCQSKIYVDTKTGVKHVGWYFVKRNHYGDYPSREAGTYLQGAWVTVYREAEPARPRQLESVALS